MGQWITTRQAAQLADRSTTTINRDANAGRLVPVLTFPGYHGARLFDEDDVRACYLDEDDEAGSWAPVTRAG